MARPLDPQPSSWLTINSRERNLLKAQVDEGKDRLEKTSDTR